MRMNNYLRIIRDREEADQGDFFFAKIHMPDGKILPHPVFIIGKNYDSNDKVDVIICICTSEDSRTGYDIPVQLKKGTYVRTNKIMTTVRQNLLFKIPQRATPDEFKKIIDKAKLAISIR